MSLPCFLRLSIAAGASLAFCAFSSVFLVAQRGGTAKRAMNETSMGDKPARGVRSERRQPKASVVSVRNETSQQEASAVTGAVRKEIREPTAGEVRNETSAPNKQTTGRVTNNKPQENAGNDTKTTQQEKAEPTSANAASKEPMAASYFSFASGDSNCEVQSCRGFNKSRLTRAQTIAHDGKLRHNQLS